MSHSPRVLIVAPTYTHPQNQGNSARIYAMGAALKASGIRVEMLYYRMDYPEPTSLKQMAAYWDALHVLPVGPLKAQSFASCWGLDDWCADTLVDEVARLQAENSYDAVIVNYVWLSKALEGAGDALRILDTHDLFGDRHNVARRSGLAPSWYFTSISEETRGFDRADIVLAIQSDEARNIALRTKAKTMLVSHPIQPRAAKDLRPQGPKLATFGYIASANPWNQVAAISIDTSFADTELDWLMAGRICDVPVASRSHPIIMGKIDDVADFYNAVSCTLNPMPEATGLKIKTIEALAHDSPIIATKAAFAGLSSEHAFHCCGSIDDMTTAAKELIKSPKVMLDLRQAGREIFFSYLSDVQNQYDALCQTISAGRKSTGDVK